MSCGCVVSREPGTRSVCALFDVQDGVGSGADGLVVAIREIVGRFRIEWELTPYRSPESTESAEGGFVLDLKGSHELAGHDPGRTCAHCFNLMLGLRIVGDWLFPSEARCPFCEVQACSKFVRGDELGQQEAISTRTLRLASRGGSPCQIGACQILCMGKTKERLSVIGAVERKRSKHQRGG